MVAKVDKMGAHGCNVFINRQLIYNYPEQLFKERKIMAIEHSDFEGTERLAAVLGSVIKFSGCAENEACSIVLRGASSHILDEAERSLHDALAVLYQTVQETRVVYGGGAMECAMAQAIQDKMATVEGKESLAMESFGAALRTIPAIMADNGGYDSAELVGALRACHARGQHSHGLNFLTATVGDMKDL